MTSQQPIQDRERSDILETLSKHRGFLLQTVQGVSDADAAERTTVSELCLGGLIKHVSSAEQGWATFIVDGPARSGPPDEAAYATHAASFRMEPGETLAALVAEYQEIAARTDEL
ncbi:MAG TPA: DUF664 domain-containing protein, partial [Acidimicrobiia bacterium]